MTTTRYDASFRLIKVSSGLYRSEDGRVTVMRLPWLAPTPWRATWKGALGSVQGAHFSTLSAFRREWRAGRI